MDQIHFHTDGSGLQSHLFHDLVPDKDHHQAVKLRGGGVSQSLIRIKVDQVQSRVNEHANFPSFLSLYQNQFRPEFAAFFLIYFSLVAEIKMALEQKWISFLKTEVQKSPLLSNVIFSFVLLGLEKLVEVEFLCPCDPNWNRLFAAGFFVAPAVVVFLLMMNIQGWKRDCYERIKAVCYSLVPSLVWLIILFLDGRYFVCAQTDWPGKFVVLAEAAPQKWCKPTNQTSSEELMKKNQEFASRSQGIGIGLIMILALPLLCTMCCKNSEENSEERSEKQDSSRQQGMNLEAFEMTNVSS